MINKLLILFSLIALNKCRENYNIHNVNISDRREDLSIVATKYYFGYIFRVKPGFIKENTITRATLLEQINSTGWGHLLVQSSAEYSDELQAYMSGVIEGIICKPLIAAHWSNTYQGYCSETNKYCTELYSYLEENFLSIIKKSKKSDGFLKMIRLKLWQIKGLQDGFDGNWKSNSSDITESYLVSMRKQLFLLYLLQADCDLGELAKILGYNENHSLHIPEGKVDDGRCSAFIKYINGTIYSAHVTWSPYNNMLRLTKLYDFSYRINADEKSSPFVPARKVSFSSYPGQLSSLDDFYVTSAGLVTIETSISNCNKSLYKPLRNMASEIVLEYARADAANLLATSGSEWSDIFSNENSGTYGNQWMIVNINLMQNHRDGDRIPDGTLYVVEQLPGLIISEDVTDHLRTSTYWASYNIPYNKIIWDVGDFQSNVKLYGDFFDYNKAPRALMFKRNASSVVDDETLMRLMRYNDYEHDPLAHCDCSPPYSAINGISSRSDLNMQSGKYPFPALSYKLQGGTDLKFTNVDLANKMKFVAICGPTYDQQPVFDWNKIRNSSMKHNMHPQRFEFPPVLTPFT